MRSCHSASLKFDLIEGFASSIERLAAGHPLPALNGRVHIQRMKLDAVATPLGSMRSEKRCATAEKGIEHDVIALRQIEVASGANKMGLTVG